MLDTKLNYQTTFLTPVEYAEDAFKMTGRTVMVTRSGDAPIVPLRLYDEARDIDLIVEVADQDDIDELMKIPEMRKRFQILESVPYTDIIIGHEVPTERQLALKKKRKENIQDGLDLFVDAISILGTIAIYAVAIPIVIFRHVVCGVDPGVWARLPDGEWLEIARYWA
jgi:hypothetical protein